MSSRNHFSTKNALLTAFFLMLLPFLTWENGYAQTPDRVGLTVSTSVTAGTTSATFTISILDSGGNEISATAATTFTLATFDESGTATFSPATTITIPQGSKTATFTYTNTKVGDGIHQITATRSGGVTFTSNNIGTATVTVNPGPAQSVQISGLTSVTAGATTTFTLTLFDANNNLATASGTTTFTLTTSDSPGTATFTASTAQINPGTSSTTFTYENSTVGGGDGVHTITATRGGGDVLTTPFVSADIIVNPGPQNKFLLSANNLNPIAGSTVNITAQVTDVYGNPRPATGPTTVNFSNDRGSVQTSGIVVDGTGKAISVLTTSTTVTETIVTATDQSSASGNLGSASITITSIPGAVTTMTISAGNTQTATVNSQLSTMPAVLLKDINNNVVGNATVTFTGGSATPTTTTTDANGIASTTWTLGTLAGPQTLTATSYNNLTVNFSATAFAGSPTKYIVTGETPSPAPSSSQIITAQLADTYGNAVATSGQSVTWALTSGSGSVTPTTSTTNSSGIATTTYTAGSGSGTTSVIQASDGTPRVGTYTTTTITIGAAAALAITTQPSGAASGALLAPQPVIQIRDSSGNHVNTATNTVTVSVSGGGTLGGTTSVAAVGGVATFSDLTLAGIVGTNYQLTFSSGSLTPTTSGNVTVTAGTAAKLAVSNVPAAGTTGNALAPQPIVVIQDAQGNSVTSGSYSVTMTASAGATLSGTTTISSTSGTATFSGVTLTGTPGATYTLTFTSTPTLTAATAAVTVPVGSATKLALTTAPVGGASGAAFTTQPVVSIQDSFNNVVNTATNTVSVSVSAGATLTGTTTVTPVNGVATFTNLGLTGASGVSYTLTFTSTPALTTVSTTVTLTAGSSSKLVVFTQPVAATNQAPLTIQPVVRILDSSDNLVSTATNTITVSATGGAVVGGTTSVAAVGGVATFSGLTLSGAVGTDYQLVFSSTGLTSATSSPTFLTGPGAASKLALTNAPVAGVSGAPFVPQPRLEIRDAQNNLVTSSTAQVSAQVTSGEGGIVSIQGVTNAVAGVAQFTNMALSGTTGVTYTISFSSGSLTPATMTATVAAPLNKPTVITGTATSVMSTSATLGGTVSDTGSSAITARGVCYSATTTSPTLSSASTTCTTASGTSTGTFTVAVTGLSISTLYYTSAYATNAQGTAYGSTVTFTTTALENPVPVVTSISPDAGSPGQEVSVTITGANFATGATIVAMTGVTVSEVVRSSATSITAKFTLASDATIGNRTVKVSNPSPGGGASETSATFRVTLPAPNPNNTSWPAGTLVQTSSTPKFEWATVSNTVDYDIQVSNLSSFTQSLACEINCDETQANNFVNTFTGITGTNFTLASPLSVGFTYYWRIRANTSTVKGVWSNAIPFTVIPPPNPPGLVSPANNSLGLTGSVTLTWTQTASTTGYELEVYRDVSLSLTSRFFENTTSSSTTTFTMPAFAAGSPVEYFWRVRSVGPGGKGAWSDVYRYTRAKLTSNEDDKSDIPTTFSLEQNYPNPFNPSTTIRFGLPESAPVTLEVYNLQGQKVAVLLQNATKSAGIHTISFDASNLSTGVYVYRIMAGTKYMASQKMMLLK